MSLNGDTPHARLVDILHRGRGHLAFRYTEQPVWGTVMDASKARMLDGTTPKNGTYIRCGTCGEVMDSADAVPVGSNW